jgi:hypothetical protein
VPSWEDSQSDLPFLALPRVRNVRRCHPLFYPGWSLCEVLVSAEGEPIPGLFSIVVTDQAENRVRLLDRRSPIIHEMNGSEKIALGDDRAAADYIRFFCAHVHGEHGAFQVIERVSDIDWRQDAGRKLLSGAEAVIAPLVIKKREENGVISAEATIRYSDHLFLAEFALKPGGSIEMVQDKPVMENLPVRRERFRGPLRFLD